MTDPLRHTKGSAAAHWSGARATCRHCLQCLSVSDGFAVPRRQDRSAPETRALLRAPWRSQDSICAESRSCILSTLRLDGACHQRPVGDRGEHALYWIRSRDATARSEAHGRIGVMQIVFKVSSRNKVRESFWRWHTRSGRHWGESLSRRCIMEVWTVGSSSLPSVCV